MGYSHK